MAKKTTSEKPKTNSKKAEEKESEIVDLNDLDEEQNENESESESEEEIKDTESESDKINALKDQLLRNQAEFENFRKRNEKEKLEMFTSGSMNVLEKILPVLDNFDRGLENADDSPFAEGIKMIHKQLMTTLEEIGVTEINAKGETFDPNFHNAVMHEENENAGEQEITEVLQTGYMYKDHVLRHSMVKVAN